MQILEASRGRRGVPGPRCCRATRPGVAPGAGFVAPRAIRTALCYLAACLLIGLTACSDPASPAAVSAATRVVVEAPPAIMHESIPAGVRFTLRLSIANQGSVEVHAPPRGMRLERRIGEQWRQVWTCACPGEGEGPRRIGPGERADMEILVAATPGALPSSAWQAPIDGEYRLSVLVTVDERRQAWVVSNGFGLQAAR